MSFAAVEYLPFLTLVVAAYTLAPDRLKAATLLAASWLCYLWVEPRDGLWLAASTLVDFFVARRIHASAQQGVRKRWLWVSLVVNLGLLATFKYAGFVVTNLGRVSSALGGPAFEFEGYALPLGISFYTFQTLSYTLDVYRKRLAPARSFIEFALYVSFFPQLVAGPIERGGHLLPQLRRLVAPRANDLLDGARGVCWGLAKKWLVADPLRAVVWPVFSAPRGEDSLTLFVAATGMWVMLYLDFSAYTDIARGSARIFGVTLVANFDRPFLATSFRDWAGRWHTSLSNWMFDYVWGPLAKGKPTVAKVWRANICVMALFGLWHGASWSFLLWGVGYGVLLSLEHGQRLRAVQRGEKAGARPTRARSLMGWACTTFLGVQFIQLFFAPDLAFVAEYQAAQWTGGLPASLEEWRWVGSLVALYAALLAVHAAGAVVDLERLWSRTPWPLRVIALVALFAFAVTHRVAEPLDFVYFRF
jgi:alginate O-acetyltransferase complex protein AlgI